MNLAVAEYAEVMKLLPPGTSLREAVTNFARRHNTVRDSRNVPELVVEYIAAKEKAARSEAHLRDINSCALLSARLSRHHSRSER